MCAHEYGTVPSGHHRSNVHTSPPPLYLGTQPNHVRATVPLHVGLHSSHACREGGYAPFCCTCAPCMCPAHPHHPTCLHGDLTHPSQADLSHARLPGPRITTWCDLNGGVPGRRVGYWYQPTGEVVVLGTLMNPGLPESSSERSRSMPFSMTATVSVNCSIRPARPAGRKSSGGSASHFVEYLTLSISILNASRPSVNSVRMAKPILRCLSISSSGIHWKASVHCAVQ